MTRPSQRPAISRTADSASLAAVGGQDQHGAAQLGGDGLVAQDDLGVVGAGQVGEDDAVGGVAALGELPAELAGGVLQLGGGGQDPVAGVGRGRPSDSRMTRETVAIETPACRATSRIVGRASDWPPWLPEM